MHFTASLSLLLTLLLLGGCKNAPSLLKDTKAEGVVSRATPAGPTLSGDSCLSLLTQRLRQKGLLQKTDVLVLDHYDSTWQYYVVGQGVNTRDKVEFHTWWQYYPISGKVINALTLEQLPK